MSTLNIKSLKEQRSRAIQAARGILERNPDGAKMSAEDERAYRKANGDIDRLGLDIKQALQDQEIEQAFGAAHRNKFGNAGNASATVDNKVITEIRSDLASQTITKRHVDLSISDVEMRDIMISNPGHGPEVVPTSMARRIFEKVFADSAVLAAGPTVFRSNSGEPFVIPRMTALGALSQADARRVEGGQIQKADPSLDQVTLNSYKYAQIMQVSREMVEDANVEIQDYMARWLGRNIANYIGLDLTTGSGVSLPLGVVTGLDAGNKLLAVAGAAGLPSGTNAKNDFDRALDVMAKVPNEYRRNGKWLVNDASLVLLRKLKTSDGNYAWQESAIAGQPDRFLGHPILSDPNITALGIGAADGTVIMLFGDFEAYAARIVRDVRIEWSTEFAWDYDLVSVKAILRVDGEMLDNAAFAALTRNTT